MSQIGSKVRLPAAYSAQCTRDCAIGLARSAYLDLFIVNDVGLNVGLDGMLSAWACYPITS